MLISQPRIVHAAALAAAYLIGATGSAQAVAIGVLGATYTVTHTSGFGPTDTDVDPAQGWVPQEIYNQTLSQNGNSSRGVAGTGELVQPNLVALGFTNGTGLSQNLVEDAGHTAASLQIDFSVSYATDLGGFPPDIFSWANFTLGGSVSNGPGSFVMFEYFAEFRDGGGADAGELLGGTLMDSLTINTPGAFGPIQLFEVQGPQGNVEGEDPINLNGYLRFTVYDGDFTGEGSSIAFSRASGVIPDVPVPAGLPLLAGGLAVLTVLKRRRS